MLIGYRALTVYWIQGANSNFYGILSLHLLHTKYAPHPLESSCVKEVGFRGRRKYYYWKELFTVIATISNKALNYKNYQVKPLKFMINAN